MNHLLNCPEESETFALINKILNFMKVFEFLKVWVKAESKDIKSIFLIYKKKWKTRKQRFLNFFKMYNGKASTLKFSNFSECKSFEFFFSKFNLRKQVPLKKF